MPLVPDSGTDPLTLAAQSVHFDRPQPGSTRAEVKAPDSMLVLKQLGLSQWRISLRHI